MAELGALLLAAGGSSRLGRSKQLLKFRGRTLVRHSAELLLGLTDHVVVVTGAQAREVGAELEDLEVNTLVNRRWREGIGTSIALGVQDLPTSLDGLLLLLCDQYRVGTEDLERLSASWRDNPKRIFAAKWGGAFGPPVIFPRQFFRQLGRLSGDLGARRLLVEQRASVRFFDLDNAAYDVDDSVGLEWLRDYELSLGDRPASDTPSGT